MADMTDLVTTARRKGTGELLLTSGLIVLYTSLRGTARALGAIERVVRYAGTAGTGIRPSRDPV
jgi:hypothetical protein